MANSTDEEELLIQSDLGQGSRTSSISPTVLPASNKYELKSMYGLLMLCVGTMMYGLIGTLTRLSMLGEDHVPYNSNAALVIAECGKLTMTAFLLCYTQGINEALKAVKSVPLKEWLLFSVPAIIYSITNNLEFYILKYMDPGSLSVLQQTKIITTAILWWYAFKQGISKQQWVSLLLLCLGSMFVAMPDNVDGNGQNQMYVLWPMGPLLIVLQVCLSAVAGIYTEFVYKKYGSNRSMHIDNLSMYFWGSLANFMQFYHADHDSNGMLHGFNVWTALLIVNIVFLGLSIAYVMKHFDNIIKLFMSGGSIIVSGVLTFFMFGLSWTAPYCFGLFIVVAAVFLYKSPTQYIK